MSVLKSLVKETVIYGLSYSLVRVLNFILLTPFLTTLFRDTKGFLSIHADIYFYIALGIAFLTYRMETAYFRFAKEDDFKNKIFIQASQFIWLSCAAFVLLVYVFNSQLNAILKFPNLESHILLAVWIIILDVICSLPFAKLRFDGKAKEYAIIKVLSVLINLLFVFLFLYFLPKWSSEFSYFKKDGNAILYFLLLANLLGSLFSFLYLYKEWKSIFTKPNWSGFSKIVDYIWPLIIVTIAYTINQYGSTSFLKYLLPGTAIENFNYSADFNAAFRLAVIMSIFVTAFNYAAEPFFFRHQKDLDAKSKYAQVSSYFTIACCVILISTCLFRDLAATLFLSGYSGSIHLISILLLSNYFVGLASNFSTWYKLTDRTLNSAMISIISLLLTFGLSIWLIPKYGVDASAWILLICNIFIAVCSYLQGQKHYPIDYPLIRILGYLTVSLILVVSLPLLINFIHLNFILASLIKFCAIGAFLWISLTIEEKSKLKTE